MIELLFITCLVAQPEVCTSRSLLFEEESGLFGCMLRGQNELVQWIETHPAEQVQEWKCRYAGEGDRAT